MDRQEEVGSVGPNDLNFYVQKSVKSLYVETLNIIEDIFMKEIGENPDKWDRLRSRILDLGNDTSRKVETLISACDVKVKRKRTTFVNVDGRLVEQR